MRPPARAGLKGTTFTHNRLLKLGAGRKRRNPKNKNALLISDWVACRHAWVSRGSACYGGARGNVPSELLRNGRAPARATGDRSAGRTVRLTPATCPPELKGLSVGADPLAERLDQRRLARRADLGEHSLGLGEREAGKDAAGGMDRVLVVRTE